MKKVLILGGTGFVGVHIVRAFLEAGHAVTVLARPGDALPDDLDVEVLRADLREPDTLVPAFEGRDLVVHSAGMMALWESERQMLYDVNVLGTRNVVDACLRAGVGRLVYTGSVGIYGGTTDPTPVDERGASEVSRFHSFHVISMCLAEREVLRGIARGLDAVAVHPAFCFGPGDHSFHSSWTIMGLARIRVPFVAPGGLNAVDVRDVAQAHLLAAEKAPAGASYLVGGENLTNRAFADLLAGILGLSRLRLPLTRRQLQRVGDLGEWVARVRGVDRGSYVTMNKNLTTAMGLYWFFDDGLARRELGYTSAPVRPAVERQVRWMEEEGYLPVSWRGFWDRMMGGRLQRKGCK